MSGALIVSDPQVRMGKPVVAGTRIPLDLILEQVGSGESVEMVLDLTRASRARGCSQPSFRRAGASSGSRLSRRLEVRVNLVADESVDRAVVDRLREEGHHVLCVAGLSHDIGDEEALRRAETGRALLLTGDKDFGEPTGCISEK